MQICITCQDVEISEYAESEGEQPPIYSWQSLLPVLKPEHMPLTPPLSAPPVFSPPLDDLTTTVDDEDDDVFETDVMDNENNDDANNNNSAPGKRRTQSLSALQSLQNTKEPQSPLTKVMSLLFSWYR